jgi:hypothetical protein
MAESKKLVRDLPSKSITSEKAADVKGGAKASKQAGPKSSKGAAKFAGLRATVRAR